ALPYLDLFDTRFKKIKQTNRFEVDVETLIRAFYRWENGDTEQALSDVRKLSIYKYNNPTYRLMHAVFQLQTGDCDKEKDLVEIGRRAIALCEARDLKLVEAYCRILILERVPKEERLGHINNLKFQFTAYGYKAGLGALSQRYG